MQSVRKLLIALAGALSLIGAGAALAQTSCPDGQTDCAKENSAPAATEEKPAFNAKQKFQQVCGLCHTDYGRKAGYGPQLMNNENSDEYLFNRVKKGKPGRMAAFGGQFSDEEIKALIAFIRSVKPGEEPK